MTSIWIEPSAQNARFLRTWANRACRGTDVRLAANAPDADARISDHLQLVEALRAAGLDFNPLTGVFLQGKQRPRIHRATQPFASLRGFEFYGWLPSEFEEAGIPFRYEPFLRTLDWMMWHGLNHMSLFLIGGSDYRQLANLVEFRSVRHARSWRRPWLEQNRRHFQRLLHDAEQRGIEAELLVYQPECPTEVLRANPALGRGHAFCLAKREVQHYFERIHAELLQDFPLLKALRLSASEMGGLDTVRTSCADCRKLARVDRIARVVNGVAGACWKVRPEFRVSVRGWMLDCPLSPSGRDYLGGATFADLLARLDPRISVDHKSNYYDHVANAPVNMSIGTYRGRRKVVEFSFWEYFGRKFTPVHANHMLRRRVPLHVRKHGVSGFREREFDMPMHRLDFSGGINLFARECFAAIVRDGTLDERREIENWRRTYLPRAPFHVAKKLIADLERLSIGLHSNGKNPDIIFLDAVGEPFTHRWMGGCGRGLDPRELFNQLVKDKNVHGIPYGVYAERRVLAEREAVVRMAARFVRAVRAAKPYATPDQYEQMERMARFTVAQAEAAKTWARLGFEFLRQTNGITDPLALKQRREEFIDAVEAAAAILREFRFQKIFAYCPTPRTYRAKAYAIYEATNLHWWMW